MVREALSDREKPDHLYDCPNDFFDSAILFVHGENPKGEGCDTGVTRLAEKLAQIEVFNSGSDRQDYGEGNDPRPEDLGQETGSRWTCNGCGCNFQSSDDQRSHFKSDWHRYNVKRRLAGKDVASEDDFSKVAEGQGKTDEDDISSISGSDTESDDDQDSADNVGLRRLTHKSNRLHFVLQKSGEIISLWRSVLLNEREYYKAERGFGHDDDGSDVFCVSEAKLMRRLKSLPPSVSKVKDSGGGRQHVWIVLLSAGGHFAGVVMNMQGGAVIAHNTFHRYVVRAKAGGRQSTRDATGRAPHSAGASLRRHNEAALQKDIRELLTSWIEYLRDASHIFVYAPSANAPALFSGENAPLDRNDTRLRRIPFTTRRPTFKEAQRVFRTLASLAYSDVPTIGEEVVHRDTQGKVESKQKGKKVGADRKLKSSRELSSENSDVIGPSEVSSREVLPLHEAAKVGNNELVLTLLENGSDPCIRDVRGKTAYALAGDKETRNVFRRYMAKHINQWDWHAADVPSPLTEEMETAQASKEAEKKAKRKEADKERKKVKKEQEKKKEAEKKAADLAAAAVANVRGTKYSPSSSKSSAPDIKSAAYLAALAKAQATEREARAAAAEIRMRALLAAKESQPVPSSGVSSQGAKSCSCCGESLSGKTPFYKFSYSYCSTTCVQVHRKYLESEDG